MPCSLVFNIKSPAECTTTELSDFVEMVVSENEVVDGLRKRVEDRGYKLVFVSNSISLVAVGALKRPNERYRCDVFEKAGTKNRPGDFCLELGWIVVSPESRRKGLAGRVVDKLLGEIYDKNVFATTRADNNGMHRCLEKRGFKKTGRPYPSKNRDVELMLFVK